MRVTCVTPRYLPNAHHIFRLAEVDVAIFLDLAKMPHRNRNSFVNRNRIVNRSSGRGQWLTVPVMRHENDSIAKTIADPTNTSWRNNHIRSLQTSYPDHEARAPGFIDRISKALRSSGNYLVNINMETLGAIFCALEQTPPLLVMESDLVQDHPQEVHRLHLSRMVGATTYVAGQVEWVLLQESGELLDFRAAGIEVVPGGQPLCPEDVLNEYRYLSSVHSILSRGIANVRRDILAGGSL